MLILYVSKGIRPGICLVLVSPNSLEHIISSFNDRLNSIGAVILERGTLKGSKIREFKLATSRHKWLLKHREDIAGRAPKGTVRGAAPDPLAEKMEFLLRSVECSMFVFLFTAYLTSIFKKT